MKYKKEISAGGIVYKKVGGQILWLTTQHSQHRRWTFPKGLVGDSDKDESREDAALREVGEEGGVKVAIADPNPIQIHYEYRFGEFMIDKTVYYFLMEYLSGDIKDHDYEVSDSKFLPEDEIRKILTFKEDKKAFEDILVLFRGVDKQS